MPESPATRPRTAEGAEIGALIGGAFGLLFLIINSSSFSSLGRTLVMATGIIAFGTIAVVAVRSLLRLRAERRQTMSAEDREPGRRREPPFGRAYWTIVLIEAIALFAGARVLSSLGHPELGVAWVAFVVGTHFYALGYVFKLNRFHVLATVVTLCGIAGFIAFFASIPAFIPIFSGVISGFVLLAFGLWALVPVEQKS
ncbi:MAG: hypothetical protein ACTH2U_11715 [Brevibacterium sp.]